jgi:hypothetical protein
MSKSKSLTAQEFQSALRNYSGSENLYFDKTPLGRIEYTDGIRFLRQNGCAWLIDAIASYQTHDFKAADDRQFWKLRVDLVTRSAKLICDDGIDNVRVTQDIPYTDFLLSQLDIYVEISERVFLCLMSEY